MVVHLVHGSDPRVSEPQIERALESHLQKQAQERVGLAHRARPDPAVVNSVRSYGRNRLLLLSASGAATYFTAILAMSSPVIGEGAEVAGWILHLRSSDD